MVSINPYRGEPYAEITRHGKWTYTVRIIHGIMRCGLWNVSGEKRANRKAIKELAKYRIRDARRQAPTRVFAA